MSRAGRIARRGLLLGAVAVAGGAAFGVWTLRRTARNPLVAGPGAAVLTPYLIITDQGITVITPRAEMGQGNQSTLAALVAEELDAPWSMIRAEHGPPAPVYANRALLGLGLPMKEAPDTGTLGAMLATLAEGIPRAMGLQVTGGSTAIRDAYLPMRKAGAAARIALVEAAAARWRLPRSRLSTRDGAVHAPDGRSLPYGALAAEAARRPLPGDPPLRPRNRWRLLGQSLPRLDMPAKVAGRAAYGIDTRLPGMLFATVRMNPRLGGGMRGFDPAPARNMPGVRKVVDLGTGIGVIATDSWTAMEAAAAIPVRWEDAPYPADSAAIMARIAAAFASPEDSALRDQGTAPALLDRAPPAQVIAAEYRVPFLAHTTMEPMNATALFTGDALELWVGTQAPLLVQKKAAAALGLAPGQVTVHVPFLGGGFGRRTEPDAAILAARLAAALPGTPVNTTWSREEDITHDYYRPAAIGRFRALAGAEGITALEGRIAAPSLMRQSMRRIAGFAPPGADRSLVEGAHDQPYAIPHYRIAGHVAELDVPVGYWRSVGYSHNAFFHECFLDEIAHARGLDPVALRLRLTRGTPAETVIRTVARMARWDAPRQPGNGRGVGRGVAFCRSFGAQVAQIVEIRDTPAGIRLERLWAAVDVGVALDPDTIRAQITSGALYGLSAAMMGEITFSGGEVEQLNFPDYDALRMDNAPAVEVAILQNQNPVGGIGEPGTPPAAPALANALFDLTGRRVRELPLNRSFDFA